MLVGAFEIEVGRPLLLGPVAALQREDMGAAAVEPDVEDVADQLIVVGVAIAEEVRGIVGVPGVDALALHGGDDALVDFMVDQGLAGLAVDEQGDRHAPGALAREHPVGPLLDHGADAVLAFFRHPAGRFDRLQRAAAQGRAVAQVLVHRHEPLRGAAVDDLRLGPPGMRVAVPVVGRGGEQGAGLAQVGADRPVGGVELGVDYRSLAAKPRPVLAILAVGLDREDGVDAMRLAQLEIVLAMVGRHMDQAGAAVGGDELAGQEGAGPREEAAEMVHRVAGDGAGEFGAFQFSRHVAECK